MSGGAGSPYELQAPTQWASPPARFSFSSLQAIAFCPRRWQLRNSEWGSFSRFPERSHPAAVEGQIVHDALDLLSRAMGRHGRPAVGSVEFREASTACGFWEFFDEQVNEWNARVTRHPRTGPGFIIRTAPRELANRAVRLFREQYRPSAVQALAVPQRPGAAAELETSDLRLTPERPFFTELTLNHPSLSLVGTLDLVTLDHDGAVVIVDYKTGAAKEAHRSQLLIYAMLWWRCSGNAPDRIAVQYLDGGWDEPVSEAVLAEVERRTAGEIDAAFSALSRHPGPPRTSPECARCPVRARCDEGWARVDVANVTGRTADVELTVASEATATGFTGARRDGRELAVVYESAVGRTLPSLATGTRVRLIDAVVADAGKALELRAWSEMFLL